MEAERERLRNLQRKISDGVAKMRTEIQANPLIPNNAVLPLLEKLEAINTIMDPQRFMACYVVGNTSVGKSSIINEISEEEVCKVSENEIPGTTNFQRIVVPHANATFIDTIGFSSGDEKCLSKEIQNRGTEIEFPDVIMLVVTKENLRDEAALKRITGTMNNLLKWLKKNRRNVEVPMVCVLNKIDDYFGGEAPKTEDASKVDEHSEKVLEKVNSKLDIKIQQCIAVSARKEYKIDDLRNILNVNAPLNAQICQKNVDFLLASRKNMARKIIAAFSIATAAVALLPIADLVIIPLIAQWMFKILACFSVDSSRTAESFQKAYFSKNILLNVVCGGILVAGDLLALTGIGYVAGLPMSMGAASGITATLGWSCYNYMT